MAKVLIITGRLAEPIVRRAVEASGTRHVVEVFTAPIDVAALLTADYVAKLLSVKGVKASVYDYIMLPGLAQGSGIIVEKATGVRTVKGPVNAYDLADVLKLESLDTLSPDKPADEVLQSIYIDKCRRILIELEEKAKVCGLSIGGLYIPVDPPPVRVMSEVVFSHALSEEALIERVKYLIESGADMISLGFAALEPHPNEVYRTVKAVKKAFDIPIAIDSPIPSEIIKGVEAGCDMIINVDLTNIDKIQSIRRDVALVVIPRNPQDGSIPISYRARVELLMKTVNAAKSYGFEKVFADAILDPIGSTFTSMLAFHEFKKLKKEVPMLMGVGNVTELIDADGVGVNALLVGLAQEIGVSIVLTVEHSVKAQGSTREVKIASQMMAIATAMNSPPKDLGISLLVLKDKKRFDTPMDSYSEVVVASEEERHYTLDPMGIFKIRVNHCKKVIEALYIGRRGRILIRGRTANSIRNEIVARELVTQISHALYLGVELGKAEEALRLGKNYVQEFPLFTMPKPIDVRSSKTSTVDLV